MKNLNSIKKTARTSRSASTKIKAHAKQGALPRVDDALGILESAYDKVKGSVSAMPGGIGRIAKAEFVVPVAIGSFVLGVGAAALGMFLVPKIRRSEAYSTMRDNLQNATASVSDRLASALHDVKASISEKVTTLKSDHKDLKTDVNADTAARVS